MFNFLFLLQTAFASDVYEGCVVERQEWNDRYQEWVTTSVESHYSDEPVQFIINEKTFQVERRERRPIIEKYTKDGDQCWKEHEHSFFCYDKQHKHLYWEFHYKNGKVTRDVVTICAINGEAP